MLLYDEMKVLLSSMKAQTSHRAGEHTNFVAFVHQQCSSSQASHRPASPIRQIMILLLRSLGDHFGLLIGGSHGSSSTGLHFCVLYGRRSTRRVPGAFTGALIDEEPATIRGIPFSNPARRKAVIGVARGSGAVEGTFTCMLIDTDQKSISGVI